MSGMGSGFDPRGAYVFKCVCGDEDNALVLVDQLNGTPLRTRPEAKRGGPLSSEFVYFLDVQTNRIKTGTVLQGGVKFFSPAACRSLLAKLLLVLLDRQAHRC